MTDLMLLGVLRAPTPDPDNILGVAQLADRARQAADEIERLTAELKLYRTGEAYTLAAAEIGRLRVALEPIKWKSCHKDNMEFTATISCYHMDRIREALKDD